jgi:hypothetical protein
VSSILRCGYFNHTKQFEFHVSIRCFSEGFHLFAVAPAILGAEHALSRSTLTKICWSIRSLLPCCLAGPWLCAWDGYQFAWADVPLPAQGRSHRICRSPARAAYRSFLAQTGSSIGFARSKRVTRSFCAKDANFTCGRAVSGQAQRSELTHRSTSNHCSNLASPCCIRSPTPLMNQPEKAEPYLVHFVRS